MSSPLSLAWRLARRELRSGLGGFTVLLACLTLGVAAIAAVGVLNAGVLDGMRRDATALLGGDLRIESTNFPVEEAELAAILPEPARRADVVATNAMASGPAGRRVVVVALKAVDGAYPLYGAVQLDPPEPLPAALQGRGVAVERGLLARLDAAIGDTITIGAAAFQIRAVVEREPDRLGGFVSIGPRALISLADLPATEVIQPGSLARYSYRYALPPGQNAEAVLAAIKAAHPEDRWQARGPRDIEPRITRVVDRLASYLTVAGLTALLIGGVGVALAVQSYLAGKTATIATFKCLGAPSGLVFRIYLLQVLVLAGLGVLLGLMLGQALPYLVRWLTEGLLPVRIVTGFYPLPLLVAAGCGLLTALSFALWPLARAREVSAAGMFRALIEPPRRWPARPVLALLGACLLGLAGLAVIGVTDKWLAAIFVGVAALAAPALAGLARLLLAGLRLIGQRGSARLRMALANLHRPGAQAASVVVALGAGLTVLTMVALLGRNLAAEVEQSLAVRVPSMFMIDIQPNQRAALEQAIAGIEGAAIQQLVPIIRGRVVRINGVPADQTGIQHWTLRQDRGFSYAGPMPAGTELVAGSWWPADYQGPPLVSIEDEVAEAYGVGVGDKLAFNVLGRVIEAEIASLRPEIDWSQGRLDFVFLFSPGVLEAAPHTLAAAVDLPAEAEPALLDAVATQLPNVTPISMRQLADQLAEVMGQIRLAVAAVAGVTLTSGVLVLAGAVAAARRRHLYESVVLKVLGARRRDLLRLFAVEYLSLGLTAAVAGAMLGVLGAYVIVTFVMALPWHFSSIPMLQVTAIALALTLVAGFAGTWRLLGRPAARLLRAP
jgi:putative ABC transport system permease protein